MAERPALSAARLVALNLPWLGFNFQTSALLPVVVPAQVLLIVPAATTGSAAQAVYLGWLAIGASGVALVAQPLVGVLSDHTRSRWRGRRRPHVVWGAVLAALGAAWLTRAAGPWTFAAAFLVLQAGGNAATAAFQGLLPDLVPRRQRGTASGVLGLMTILGNAGGLGLAAALLSSVSAGRLGVVGPAATVFYVTTIGVLALSCAVHVLGTPERSSRDAPVPGDRGPHGARAVLLAWAEPWRAPNYRWVFAGRFLVITGLTLFLTFIEYYFAVVLHAATFVRDTASVALVALLVAVVGAIALGLLSDRTRRVPLAFAAALLMALASVLFLAGGGVMPLWVLGATFGLGYGAYSSVDWALAVDSLPSEHAAGRDLGVWSLASTLPGVAAPALGAAIIGAAAALGHTAEGYQGVFVAAAACFVLGAAAVLRIREAPAGERLIA